MLECIQDGEDIGVVFQPFNPRITLSKELRLFVYYGNLVAVSAVDEPNDLITEDDLRKLQKYVLELEALNSSYPNYVADACLDSGEIIFIEINPYDPDITDSILFDWTDDKDILFPRVAPTIPAYRFE
ncbi:Hypothetical protein POVR1_LOCUS578 [uncultured virus]|nr:Hypothetical protein POVR1_LOCUS578 [uncultured virus]